MKGKVYLVGAGPGDYKLLTLKGLECIKKADVIVYDRLANKNYLKEAKENCEFIYVGKASSNHTLPQDDINRVIADKAKEGKIVTRLKGGDPYVFGRGGEEGELLKEEGIEFEVVPGITSAIGGLCYAGIPITHRDHASSFHVITGHLREDDKENPEINWNALANTNGTLVFLMGVANLQKISSNLIKEGKSKDTPVALISWATRYNQRVITSTLENVYETAIKEGVKPPTLIAVGDVVGLRDKLNFFETKPLFGKNVIVTRSRTQSSSLVSKISYLGGNPIEVPTIKIEKIENNIALENEIKNRFIGKRTIPVIEEEIKEVESNIEKYETQLKASYVVSEVLTEVYDEIRSSFGPILNSNVITSFKEFTDGKYNEVMVSDNYEMKVKDDKSIMAAEALSNGANDQLYLSLRLAFVEMIFKNKDIPICLDDTFIQYDDKRLERTIKYLIKERFEQYIIFTCQKREEAVIRNNSISHKYIKL